MDNPDTNIKEIKALISMIDDPDKDIYKQIASKIFLYGNEIIPYLETAWESNPDPAVQKRIEELIHQIQLDSLKSELSLWKKQNQNDLLYGWIIVTKYKYPDLKEEDIRLELNNIRKDIWLEMNDDLTALEKVKVFNHIFYNTYGFTGNTENFHDPHNHFVNKVLETKKGNPLSLGLLYILIAQSLDIPVKGLSFPEHFILAYISQTFNPHDLKKEHEEALFYINPFSKGNAFSHQEAEWFLEQLNIEPSPDLFQPCTNSEIIERMLFSLITAYEKQQDLTKAKEVKQLFDIIIKP